MYKTKELYGLYKYNYRLFFISAPYSSHSYIFAGPPADAQLMATRLYKQKKFNYPPKIRELLG